MIITNIQNLSRYESLHPLFGKLFDYVRQHDLLNEPIGRIELQGNDLFINNDHPTCVEKERQQLEMHREYIDLHVLLEGTETIGWKATEEIQHLTVPYNTEKDFSFSDDKPVSFITLYPGQCCIVFPEDAHAPIIGQGKLRKAVGKIKLNYQK